METHKLHIFSKDTDAFNSQRGYNYQTLKTLETWVQNFLDNNKEDIFCEFEEDIFQKNEANKTVKFRQVKLYSSNFSFSSEEIKKCICHFFMLHVKSDYSDFSKEYIFETNSNIAKKYGENDADLLREWFDNQDNPNDVLLDKFSAKVKSIVSEYITREEKNIKSSDTGSKLAAQEAIKVFNGLEDAFWNDFTKMIQWRFADIEPEQEFINVKSDIEGLLLKLPHPIAQTNDNQVFSALLECVFLKVTQQGSEDRKLTHTLFEQTLLNTGNEEDKWYARRYQYYSEIEPVTEFRIGEFSEILDLVNYCRRKKYLHGHKDLWNPHLIFYAREKSINGIFRRKAIYEIVFLNNEFYEVDYENLNKRSRPNGSLIGFEEDFRFYFSDISLFKDAQEIENADIIINLLFVAIGSKRSKLKMKELRKWFVSLYMLVSRRISAESDTNEKCFLIQIKGLMLFGVNRIRNREMMEFMTYFNKILELVETAPLFKLSQFGDRIEKFIKLQINIDPTDEMGIIGVLEEFSERLFPLVDKREGSARLAKSQVQRGYSYLQTKEPYNLLKALQYFHKAKDNYQHEDTIEGYILALLNIGQLYSSVGMHFAAKNYALAAFRLSTNKQLIKRVETSLAMLFDSDFKSGAWFNALQAYGKYIHLRLDSNFDSKDIDIEGKSTQRMAWILYVMKKSSGQFTYLVDSYVRYLDYVGEEIIIPLHDKIDSELSQEEYNQAIAAQADDFPLNDSGAIRYCNFYALGSFWKIDFPNSYEVLSVAEEYISTIQTVLAEIALSGLDFHLLKSKIEITLVLSDSVKSPEQLPSNDVIAWEVYIYKFDDSDIQKINEHVAYNMASLSYILDKVSVLKQDEFMKTFWQFFRESKLDTKYFAVNLYQRIHRDIYSEKEFKDLMAPHFEKILFDVNLPRENSVMKWKNDLSAKYNRDFSIEAIKNRFNNVQKSVYLTLKELKQDPEFRSLINDFRAKGWKDWQIILNIQNYMVNYKTRQSIRPEQQGGGIEEFQKLFFKISKMD